MGLKEDLEHIAVQERELQLPRLDGQVAWDLGSRLRALAVERGLGVVIDVRRFGQPLFYAALDGTTPDHPEWVRRKSNVVARFHHSSYVAGLKEKLKNESTDPENSAAIREATERVAATSQKLGQALYANAQADGAAGGQAGPGAPSGDQAQGDDDVVDAEIVDDEKKDGAA